MQAKPNGPYQSLNLNLGTLLFNSISIETPEEVKKHSTCIALVVILNSIIDKLNSMAKKKIKQKYNCMKVSQFYYIIIFSMRNRMNKSVLEIFATGIYISSNVCCVWNQHWLESYCYHVQHLFHFCNVCWTSDWSLGVAAYFVRGKTSKTKEQ